MEHALQNDASLKADRELLRQYFLQKESIKLWENPELSLTYSNTKPDGSERKNEYGIAVIQSIQKPSLRSAKQRIVDAKIVQLNALIAQKENDIKGNVRQKGYLYVMACRISEKAEASLLLAITLRQKGEKRFEQGAISKADLLKLKVEEEKIAQEAKTALMRRENALQSLSESGRFTSSIALLEMTLPEPSYTATEIHLEALPMLAYYRGVDEEYRAEKEVAIASVIPGFKAGLGYQEMYDQHSVIASLSMPIPILHRNEPFINSAQSKRDENKLREEAYRYEITQKTVRQHQILKSLSMLILSQQQSILQAKKMESMAQKSYEEGYGTLLELIDARRVLLSNQKELYQTFENYYDTLGEIQKILPPIEDLK